MRALVLALALVTASCGRRETAAPAAAPPPAAATAPAVSAAPATPAANEIKIVVLGDSLAAGYGLPESEAFPALLETDLRAAGIAARVLNAGVSGDTTAGGVSRLDWLLKQAPDVMVVELGANDGLRGLPLAETEANLRTIVERSRAAGAKVLLVGMRVPTSMGVDYGEGFAAIFPRLAAELGVPLVPFLLEGVALVPELNQVDGIHPTAEGHRRLAATVLPHLVPLARR